MKTKSKITLKAVKKNPQLQTAHSVIITLCACKKRCLHNLFLSQQIKLKMMKSLAAGSFNYCKSIIHTCMNDTAKDSIV